jgi:GGDEF domain-containing protein
VLDLPSVLELVASRITSSLAEPMVIDAETVRIGASVGIAHAAPSTCSLDSLMDAADAALYAAKADGRGGWRVKLPS